MKNDVNVDSVVDKNDLKLTENEDKVFSRQSFNISTILSVTSNTMRQCHFKFLIIWDLGS